MPWKSSDAKKFTKKAKSAKAQRQWKDVSNSTRQSLLKRGVSAKEADRRAVVYANAAIKKRRAKAAAKRRRK